MSCSIHVNFASSFTGADQGGRCSFGAGTSLQVTINKDWDRTFDECSDLKELQEFLVLVCHQN